MKRFPIQQDPSGPAITIPWSVAQAAYEVYDARFGGQTLERLADRGGFGRLELLWLLDGATGWPLEAPLGPCCSV